MAFRRWRSFFPSFFFFPVAGPPAGAAAKRRPPRARTSARHRAGRDGDGCDEAPRRVETFAKYFGATSFIAHRRCAAHEHIFSRLKMFEELRRPPARFSACDRRAHARLDVPHTPAAKRRVFRLELEPCLHEESRRPRLGKTERTASREKTRPTRRGEEPTRSLSFGDPTLAGPVDSRGPPSPTSNSVQKTSASTTVAAFDSSLSPRGEARLEPETSATGRRRRSHANRARSYPSPVRSTRAATAGRETTACATSSRYVGVGGTKGRRVRRSTPPNVSFAERFVRCRFVRGRRGERAESTFAQRNRRRRNDRRLRLRSRRRRLL